MLLQLLLFLESKHKSSQVLHTAIFVCPLHVANVGYITEAGNTFKYLENASLKLLRDAVSPKCYSKRAFVSALNAVNSVIQKTTAFYSCHVSERTRYSFCASLQTPVRGSRKIHLKGSLLIFVLYFRAKEDNSGTADNHISEG